MDISFGEPLFSPLQAAVTLAGELKRHCDTVIAVGVTLFNLSSVEGHSARAGSGLPRSPLCPSPALPRVSA